MKKFNITAYDRKQAKELFAQGYKYFARDEAGVLTAFEKKPFKHSLYGNVEPYAWASYEGKIMDDIKSFGFKFIKWEDEEPTLIADILQRGKK